MAIGDQQGAEGARTAPAGTRRGGRLEALAPLTGIVGVVFLLIATFVFQGVDEPEEKDPPEAYLAFFRDEEESIFISTLAFALGLMFILWFIGTLRAALARAEGEPHRLSSLVLAGGTGMVVCLLGALAPTVSGAIAVEEEMALTPDAAQAIWIVGDALFVFGWFLGGLMLVAAGLALLRTGLMPRWFAYVTLAMGVLMPIWFVGWLIFFFLFPIWLVALSIVLYRRNTAPRAVT